MTRYEIPGMIFAFLLVVGFITLIGKCVWWLGSWVFGG